MQKRTIIKNIKRIIEEWGGFGIDEVGAEFSPCVDGIGHTVHLAEYFDKNSVSVNVYNPSSYSSDPIDDYELSYEELNKDILEEILIYAENYEADCLKTEKRISN